MRRREGSIELVAIDGSYCHGNGYLSSQCILLVARYSRDKISGKPCEARYEVSSRRTALIRRDLFSQHIPHLVEDGPYRRVIDAHSHSVSRSAV